jgi:ArsR family transcriptional regulator, arsenate/arsenite/antimonite-responsive transcriptional repressor
MNKDTEEQAALFRALADPTRLKLVKLLCRQREPSALCVNALAYRLGISQSAVSQHLRVLKALKLVKAERRGYRVHYFINKDEIKHLRTLISSALSIEDETDKQKKLSQHDSP